MKSTAFYQRRRALGLCATCGGPSPNAWQCPGCASSRTRVEPRRDPDTLCAEIGCCGGLGTVRVGARLYCEKAAQAMRRFVRAA